MTEADREQNLRLVRELRAKYPGRVRALLDRARAKLVEERKAEEEQKKEPSANPS